MMIVQRNLQGNMQCLCLHHPYQMTTYMAVELFIASQLMPVVCSPSFLFDFVKFYQGGACSNSFAVVYQPQQELIL